MGPYALLQVTFEPYSQWRVIMLHMQRNTEGMLGARSICYPAVLTDSCGRAGPDVDVASCNSAVYGPDSGLCWAKEKQLWAHLMRCCLWVICLLGELWLFLHSNYFTFSRGLWTYAQFQRLFPLAKVDVSMSLGIATGQTGCIIQSAAGGVIQQRGLKQCSWAAIEEGSYWWAEPSSPHIYHCTPCALLNAYNKFNVPDINTTATKPSAITGSWTGWRLSPTHPHCEMQRRKMRKKRPPYGLEHSPGAWLWPHTTNTSQQWARVQMSLPWKAAAALFPVGPNAAHPKKGIVQWPHRGGDGGWGWGWMGH